MDYDDFTLYFTLSLNLALATLFALHYRRCFMRNQLIESQAKSRFTWACVGCSLFTGIVILFSIVIWFNVATGHGVLLITAPIAHAILCVLLIMIGRLVIGWKSLIW